MNTDRDSWTEYAKRNGLLRENPPAMAPADVPAARLAPPNKYGARRIQINGIWFDSIKESERYQELLHMQRAGLIADLELQPVFPLHIMELYRSQTPIAIRTAGRFTADFRYTDLTTGEIVVEDVKSCATRTEAYGLRKTVAEIVHGVFIREL